jgi:RNA ligase (TIGR02306 family)
MSRGLVVSLKELEQELAGVDLENSVAVCEALGITHYERPCKAQDAKGNLPPGIEKSDEENWQAMKEHELHLGETALITHKVDGSSAVLYYDPHQDKLEFCSRSLTLKTLNDMGQPLENNYIKALSPYIPHVKALAKNLGEIVAIRGEIYGNGINGHKVNQDAKQPLGFAMYGVRFPESNDDRKRKGRYKSGWHFLDVNEKLGKLGFAPIPTVPVIGEAVVTKELLFELSAKPMSEGEGKVLNGESWSYKAKSDDYCAKMK